MNKVDMDSTPLIMDMVSIISTASLGLLAVYVMSSMIKDKRKQYEDNPF
ncbi:MAG: hypothetical protein H2B06_00270 [Nitrosopumilaceae archaeon]|nr:hypothetical protein [Nitrosopumilaceae archaeon]